MKPIAFCVAFLSIGWYDMTSTHVEAQIVSTVVTPPVNHPVTLPTGPRTPYVWRRQSGAWGESLVEQSLRLRGYEVLEVKSGSNHGIDRIAFKRDPTGALSDVRLIEVKTHRGRRPVLSRTRAGRQMSRRWLAAKLKAMRVGGDPIARNLALEINRFRRQSGISPEMLGELHEINTRTGRYIRRNPVTLAQLSSQSIERQLKQLTTRLPSSSPRDWASRHLAQWEQISHTPLKTWSAKNGVGAHSLLSRGSSPLAHAVAGRSARRLTHLIRGAGPLGAAVAVSIDAHEIYEQIHSYRSGQINRRQLIQGLTRTGGGIVGAGSGAAAGVWIGTFGGPFAWITVPVGGVIGGTVGYFAGSAAGGAAVDVLWYSVIDQDIKKQIDAWLINTGYQRAASNQPGD